jgi:hypothetical protein
LEEALSPGSKKELSIANSTLCALKPLFFRSVSQGH